MVQDRLEAGEALEAHHLFGEERPVVAGDDVTFPGQLAESLVKRHEWRISPRGSSARSGRGTGVTTHEHRFGGIEFRLGRRELGHLHGERWADLRFQQGIRDMLVETGRAQPHHVLPEHRLGVEADPLEEDADEVIELFRLSYERARVAQNVHETRG